MTPTESRDLYRSQALFLDLEWTCWNAPPPPGMQQEIIEIGITEMHLTSLEIIQEASYFVRPRRWEISSMCTKLTGITAEDIRKAKPLSEVLALLSDRFSPKNKPCVTWGDDVTIMGRSCTSLGLVNPFRASVDLSKVFQGVFLTKDQVSVRTALGILNMEFEGVPHGALPDARNTARIHAALLGRLRREPEPVVQLVSDQAEIASLTSSGKKLREALS